MVRDLLEVEFKPIGFKELFIIRWIIIHPNTGVHKALNKQAPVHVIFTEVYRPVHCLHSPGLKPIPAGIKQEISGFLIVNNLEKTHSSRWLLKRICLSRINESSHTACHFPCAIFQYPANSLTMVEKTVGGGIKYQFDFLVERPYIISITQVNSFNHVEKGRAGVFVGYFYDFHKKRSDE